jgi:hypothetical protein
MRMSSRLHASTFLKLRSPAALLSDELLPGRLIVSVSRHDVAVIGVVIHFATARAMKRGGSMDI